MTCGLATALEPPHFNHAPVRGAIGASFSRRSRAGSFNPRTRVGCDSPPTNRIFAAQEFQSTHPRGVRLAALLGLSIRVTVSIHAPAWGATCKCSRSQSGKLCFNPRTRVGCDGSLAVEFKSGNPVSIHAPAWGATWALFNCSLKDLGFNPRTRVGCDGTPIAGRKDIKEFQSTHPRGVRQFPSFF